MSTLAVQMRLEENESGDRQSNALRLFAIDCAARVLPLFEKQFPEDFRPRRAIDVARRFASGEAGEEELHDAWADARTAANDLESAALEAWDEDIVQASILDAALAAAKTATATAAPYAKDAATWASQNAIEAARNNAAARALRSQTPLRAAWTAAEADEIQCQAKYLQSAA